MAEKNAATGMTSRRNAVRESRSRKGAEVRRDGGTITPLIVGAVLVAGIVVVGTVVASAVFLAQRDLVGFCDGAAVAVVAAATTADAQGDPAIDAAEIDGAVRAYQPGEGTETTASTDGRSVEVVCTRTVRVPFGVAPDGLVRTVVARARPETR
jgi:hypothetical protein